MYQPKTQERNAETPEANNYNNNVNVNNNGKINSVGTKQLNL